MQTMKFIACLFLAIGFFGFSVANGGQRYQKNGYSISLPDGWTEIPGDMLDARETAMAKLAPNAPSAHYDYGFQLSNSRHWFEHPFILIGVKHSGRISESKLEKLEGFSVQERLDKVKKGVSPLLSEIQMGKMYYDKQTRIIWMRAEANATGTGPISGIGVMVPTEKGYIEAFAWSLKNDYLTYEPTFVSVAMSITPEPALLYKPKKR